MPDKLVGVIGSGKFGITIANLLAENVKVLLYARRQEIADEINDERSAKNIQISERVSATNSLQELADKCILIFPILPSSHFRMTMRELGAYLTPQHILIHGTKGLDIDKGVDGESVSRISLKQVRTMSETIQEETSVLRIGCISVPNLSSEINEGQLAATVIASEFDEVIEMGQKALTSGRFFVFGSHDLKGTELAGALKNILAIASGILHGLDKGENVKALLITRGLREMIHIGKLFGADSKTFLGTAGMGDVIASCSSPTSRNFNFGYRLAKGETVENILNDGIDVIEGIGTLKLSNDLSVEYKLQTPITKILYRAVFHKLDMNRGIERLMRYPFAPDVDFL